jgi:hypothetical protein
MYLFIYMCGICDWQATQHIFSSIHHSSTCRNTIHTTTTIFWSSASYPSFIQMSKHGTGFTTDMGLSNEYMSSFFKCFDVLHRTSQAESNAVSTSEQLEAHFAAGPASAIAWEMGRTLRLLQQR